MSRPVEGKTSSATVDVRDVSATVFLAENEIPGRVRLELRRTRLFFSRFRTPGAARSKI